MFLIALVVVLGFILVVRSGVGFGFSVIAVTMVQSWLRVKREIQRVSWADNESTYTWMKHILWTTSSHGAVYQCVPGMFRGKWSHGSRGRSGVTVPV